MRLLIFCVFVVFVNGYDIPDLLVNITEPGSAWLSFPEKDIKSVFFAIEGDDKCEYYVYKCDPKEVHPWATHESLNHTRTIHAILETNQNKTVIGSFKVTSKGISEKHPHQPVKKIINHPLNSSPDLSCLKFRKDPNVCIPSISKVGKTHVKCSGELLYSDSFENMDNWTHIVIHRNVEPHFEGVSFKTSDKNSYIENETLHLKVTNSTGEVHLDNCSFTLIQPGDSNLKCGPGNKTNTSYFKRFFLPPFQAAMLQSKQNFSHVRIDIEAKVARGDFLFSGMQLATENDAINIAIVRGNSELKDSADNEVGGKNLFAGVLRNSPDDTVEPHEADQFYSSNEHFGNKFHTYSAIWKSDSITFKLNGQTYAIFDNKDIMEEISFNDERSIRLFLTVAGELNFPDSRIVKGKGTFRNSNPKISAYIKSHVDSSNWIEPKLSIRSIKVYSTDENEI